MEYFSNRLDLCQVSIWESTEHWEEEDLEKWKVIAGNVNLSSLVHWVWSSLATSKDSQQCWSFSQNCQWRKKTVCCRGRALRVLILCWCKSIIQFWWEAHYCWIQCNLLIICSFSVVSKGQLKQSPHVDLTAIKPVVGHTVQRHIALAQSLGDRLPKL